MKIGQNMYIITWEDKVQASAEIFSMVQCFSLTSEKSSFNETSHDLPIRNWNKSNQKKTFQSHEQKYDAMNESQRSNLKNLQYSRFKKWELLLSKYQNRYQRDALFYQGKHILCWNPNVIL